MFNGKEYKDADQNALATGVTGATKASGAPAFTPVPVMVYTKASGGNGNTYVVVP